MKTDSQTNDKGVRLVSLEGAVDLSTVPELRKKLLRLARKRETKAIHLDLSRVTALDTAGVAMLVEIWRNLEHGGRKLRLTGLSENARRLLHLAQLDSLFIMEDDAA